MTPFIETSVSRDIFNTIALARRLNKNAAIVGRPGIGKTVALREYTRRDPISCGHRTIFFMTVTAVTGNALRDLLREIADVFDIRTGGTIADLQKRMFQYDLGVRIPT